MTRNLHNLEVGITTNQIDAALHDFIIDSNAYPSPLGYAGFPRSCCTSVNNVITHGIPDEHVFPLTTFACCFTDKKSLAVDSRMVTS